MEAQALLRSLSDEHREVLVRTCMYGLTVHETARRLGTAAGTVTSRRHCALKDAAQGCVRAGQSPRAGLSAHAARRGCACGRLPGARDGDRRPAGGSRGGSCGSSSGR
ncbi:sigma factor-like helix-turn-helix DNA-binding protein [Streptomyces sp. NPDC005827]|uniref:sigma factor-like helix-turn-helix DNA-binding protein n=1 Tax=Streptomyces sp. NPDC005827 TaxID=3157070 RepID=UPI00340DAD4A